MKYYLIYDLKKSEVIDKVVSDNINSIEKKNTFLVRITTAEYNDICSVGDMNTLFKLYKERNMICFPAKSKHKSKKKKKIKNTTSKKPNTKKWF